ncbi:A disintegrin and metalloproteinase with thrombospondin motifs 9-like isoform x4 [Plakobranchus ocellatus]|uniref:A disintegrin and metalloproteinase with thrombospondin motifs 9-like isoform x4 n=1 Tax=Plakobranchus ocellatus TaxID=259542 RepID=A0AAV4BY13_9GAST|nr:A disintegrin and metalloproteinase with thrombospondin motifs 9-like isoform x4 [Plakobranchus ocellatus]
MKVEAQEIHKENINIFAIGVGSGVDRSELELIASDPKNVFTVSNFQALDNIQANLQKTACAVDGQWSKWGFYSPCSKTCGGGTQFRERTCTDPAPANGGQACVGRARQTRDCNQDPCTTLPPPTTKPTIAPVIVTTPAAGFSLVVLIFFSCSYLSMGFVGGNVGSDPVLKSIGALISVGSSRTSSLPTPWPHEGT